MASSEKNLSDVRLSEGVDAGKFRYAIVVAEWNEQVTESLYSGAFQTLVNAGVDREKIERVNVPGTFELSLGGQWLAQRDDIDAVICLDCIHNLPRDRAKIALQEIQRLSGGKAFVRVDSYRTPEQKAIFESWVLTAEFHDYPEGWLKLFEEAGYTGDYYWTIIS